MTDREKIIGIIDKWANKAVITQINGASVYDQNNASELAKALLAANIGDVTAWKERAEKAERELVKYKTALATVCEEVLHARYPVEYVTVSVVEDFIQLTLKDAEKELAEDKRTNDR